ncbi:MAG: putative DNA-binding domain-containing protein [Planctomycetota bacterium]
MTASTLDSLYRWFQTEIERASMPGIPTTGPHHAAVADVIKPSRTLEPDQRIEVYQTAVRLRFIDVMATDFGVVQRVVGHEAFAKMCMAYLAAHPSRSFTLNDLCDKLPRFLRTYTSLPHHGLALDIARLERAMTRLVDADTSEVMTPEAIATVPSDQWAEARLEPIPALRVLAFRHRANAIVTAARQKHDELPPFDEVATYAAVYRKPDYVVWRMDLTRPLYVLLDSLAGGHRIGEAIEAASMEWTGDIEELGQSIFRWFGELVGEGMFRRVVLPE